MNQILYKGYTFGGVGEDVTNKQHTITLDGQELETVGGENSEVFNNYKGENINIAEGTNSTVVGKGNRELKYIKENGQYVKSTTTTMNNFISGSGNLILTGYYNFLSGSANIMQYGQVNGVIGQGNKVINYIHSFVYGSGNILENSSAGGLLVGGVNNTVKRSYQGIVCGTGNKVIYAQSPVVFGQGNIIQNGEESSEHSSIASACMVMGKINKIGHIESGCAVFGVFNEVDWNEGRGGLGTDNGALIHGAYNKVYHSHSSLIGGVGNTGCMQEGIVEGSSNKFIQSLGSLICGCGLNSANVRQSVLTGDNSKFNNINQSIFNTLDSEIGDSYSSLVLGKEFYVPSNITNSLFLGEKNKFNETIDNNYLGKTYTEVDIYFNEPNITLFEKGITPHIWTLGEQYDVMHNIYTDQCIVFYEFNKTITPYKWSNELNKWIIPENTQNTFVIGFVNEPLLNSSITRIEVYGLETTSVTATEGQSVDCYYNYCNYKNSYTFNGNTWQLSSTYPNKKNINITQNVNNSILLGSNNNFSDDTLEVEYQTFDTVETGPIGSISQIQIISTITNDKYWQRGNSHVDPQGGTQGTFTTNDGFWSLIVDGSLILAANLFYWDNEAEKWKQPIYTNEWINPDTNVPININGATLVDLGDVNTTYYSLHDCKINKTNLDLSYMIGTLQKLDQSYQKENSYEVRGGQLVLTTLDMNNTFILGNNNNFDYNRTNLKILSSNTKVLNCYNANIIGDNNEFRNSENLVNLGQSNLYIGCKDIFNLGNDNSITSITSSLILGDNNNYIGGKNNIIIGFDGETDSDLGGISDSTIIGNNTTNNGGINHMVAIGEDNNLGAGAYLSYLFGYSNTFGGGINNSYIIGKSNIIESGSQDSFVLGQNNTATAGAGTSFILGLNNIARNGSNKNFIIGYNNIVTDGRNSSISIGNNLYNIFSNGILLGRYNSYPNAPVTSKLLILGNGYVDNQNVVHRSNCLEINEDGSQEIILQDKTLTSTLGIGKIKIKQEKIIFESLKENSSQQIETVEFTFEDLKQIKQNSQLPNLDNNSYPTT